MEKSDLGNSWWEKGRAFHNGVKHLHIVSFNSSTTANSTQSFFTAHDKACSASRPKQTRPLNTYGATPLYVSVAVAKSTSHAVRLTCTQDVGIGVHDTRNLVGQHVVI
jgi:hypothetical protein